MTSVVSGLQIKLLQQQPMKTGFAHAEGAHQLASSKNTGCTSYLATVGNVKAAVKVHTQ